MHHIHLNPLAWRIRGLQMRLLSSGSNILAVWYQGHRGVRICKWDLCNVSLQKLYHHTVGAPMRWEHAGLCQHNRKATLCDGAEAHNNTEIHTITHSLYKRSLSFIPEYALNSCLALRMSASSSLIWQGITQNRDINTCVRSETSLCFCRSCLSEWRENSQLLLLIPADRSSQGLLSWAFTGPFLHNALSNVSQCSSFHLPTWPSPPLTVASFPSH